MQKTIEFFDFQIQNKNKSKFYEEGYSGIVRGLFKK